MDPELQTTNIRQPTSPESRRPERFLDVGWMAADEPEEPEKNPEISSGDGRKSIAMAKTFSMRGDADEQERYKQKALAASQLVQSLSPDSSGTAAQLEFLNQGEKHWWPSSRQPRGPGR